MKNTGILFLVFSILQLKVSGQSPHYTKKHFVSLTDTSVFKVIQPTSGNGFLRTYLNSEAEIWDTDDGNTTFIKGGETVMITVEGTMKNNKREGLFRFYLTDSMDHQKRYKIWEQEFNNNQLNGTWKTFTLKGSLVSEETYKNDNLSGISRHYWIDGIRVMHETEYFNGRKKFMERDYFPNGRILQETPYEDEVMSGIGKKYYEDGTIMEVVSFKNGQFNGVHQYYYPNGQLWIEQIYHLGLNWTVVANYTETGIKRDAGTLKDGNGTIIYYKENGTVRETVTFVNGIEKRR